MSDQPSEEFQLPQPGPEHDLLKPLVGTFKSTVKMFMGPDDPMESHGTMLNTFQVGGLYLQQEYSGDPAGPFGEFTGRGYMALIRHRENSKASGSTRLRQQCRLNRALWTIPIKCSK